MFSALAKTRPRYLATNLGRKATRSHSTRASSSNTRIAIATTGFISAPGIWWWTTARDDVPNIESSPGEPSDEPSLSRGEVSRRLSKDAFSYEVNSITGINRYDGTQLASNSPCEDRFVHGKFSPWNESDKWMSWAVFDGHAGWQTADLLTKQLLPFVRNNLSQIKPSADGVTSDQSVQHAVVKAFVDLDDSIIQTALATSQSEISLQEKAKKLAPAYSGSCALLSLYDSLTSTLHVACTGDSRAVLGRKGADGKWEAIPLSIDQAGTNEDEVARLYKEHPGEENIVKDGRVLGIMVSRGFGDSRWKWPLEFQQKVKDHFNGPAPLTPRYDVRTPPYLTAEPVVTSTKIDPSQPTFLIMATDGLWDNLSSQQGVNLVGTWLESRAQKPSSPDPVYPPFDFGQFREGVDWKFVEERTTTQDKNAAVHLVRNSLGGNHHELIAGRLAFDSPFSRYVRDDITVQVVFFNTGDKSS
ncbi:unnamed protein product [Penicillium salamii]|uniref:PPM-type phosphatase domain-containing protein n=1 Tax=Penicillium salamii TaxID=1612424 RepID=A0A9W4IMJ0_9EURO|nr:unnamed protein product [Penicillium salamii]CAG8010496.1 unnamed protein product [Penicillium salamii]CAG8067918.1 unnamed protein product [Penicillium salamii]CAG8251532.1 unnamed protein product [Penicillium salamii]CAG8310438.1 unnamed protein product [Penicillium salamii]